MASSEDALGPEWREIQWDSEQLLKKLQEFKTGNERVPKANLLFVHSDGISLMRLHLLTHATTDKNYTVTTATIRPTNLDRLHYLLDGNVSHETLADVSPVTPSHSDFVAKPTLKDKMHCVAYVVSCLDVNRDTDRIQREYLALHALTRARGIRVVIVLYNITRVCGEVQKSLRNVHRSVKIKQMVDKISKLTGMPISSIFLTDSINYPFLETNRTLGYTFVMKMLDYAKDYLAPLGIQKYTNDKGLCLILNFFSDDRKGSQQDVECLKVFWESVGCSVKVGIDLKKGAVLKTLKDTRADLNNPDNNYSYFVCVVMSHGDEMGIHTMGRGQITVTEILDVFKNDKMERFCGKPKLFVIQACQGNRQQDGCVAYADSFGPVPDPLTDKVPTDADILLAIATTPGYEAYRYDSGSWLIQELLQHLHHYHDTEHLFYILTSVCHRVGLKYETPEGYKQMPCTFSTLTKLFYV